MKLKIKIRRLKQVTIPKIINKGEWIDLYIPSYGDVEIKKGELKLIGLGIAMKLPDGFEALIVPRSSTAKNFKILLANSIGIIDNSYSGNNDEWKFNAYAIEDTYVKNNERICQFRIQLSQKANIWQKLRWLFTSGIELTEVKTLDDTDRGGFGTTGK